MSTTTYLFVENYEKCYADTADTSFYLELCNNNMKTPFGTGKSWSYDSGVVLFPSGLSSGLTFSNDSVWLQYIDTVKLRY